jgi:hypothetical protein
MLSLANSVTAQQQGPIGPPPSSGSSSTTAPAAASSAAPLHSRAEGFAESPISSEPPSIPADQIIQRFSQHESEFKKERDNYTYTQTFVFQTLDPDGVPDGEYRLTTDVSFTPEGKRYEHDTYAPVPTISRLQFTKQDLDDLRSIQPFVLTSEELPKYNVTYVGRQLIDDLHTYVFEVAPKKIEKDQRYFQGRVWVDDKDMQIVKSYGKAVPTSSKRTTKIFSALRNLPRKYRWSYWFDVPTPTTPAFQQWRRHIRFTVSMRTTSVLAPATKSARPWRSNSSAEFVGYTRSVTRQQIAARALAAVFLLAACGYAADYFVLRVRMLHPTMTMPFETITQTRVLAIPQKSGKFDYQIDQLQPTETPSCVHALFPHWRPALLVRSRA